MDAGSPRRQGTAETTFVARRPDGWSISTVPGHEPRKADINGVLTLVDGAPSDARQQHRDLPGTLPEKIAPAWLWVGRAAPGGVVVDRDPLGPALLDARNLRFLDELDPVTSTDSLSEPDREQVRLLLAAGCVVPADPGAAPPARRLDADDPLNPPEIPALAPPSPTDGLAHQPRPLSQLRHRWGRRHRRRPAEIPDGADPTATTEAPAESRSVDDRVGVFAIWHEETGPLLSLGMLTAAARQADAGELDRKFRIHPPQSARSFLDEMTANTRPAVLLCSDYVWSLEPNLEAARLAKERCPELLVIHGGPSCPKYEAAAQEFFDRHGDVADVLVRGEGEATLVRLLHHIDPATGQLDRAALHAIPGLTFRGDDGELVRTADPERSSELDSLPSPYLTGEFDHIPVEAWLHRVTIETNRGCPYGCTYCDWGSATLSRIRKFDAERVHAELAWAGSRGIEVMILADANFGIMSRDVETARSVADVRRRTGSPEMLVFYPAKNTTKHLTRIYDELFDAGVGLGGALSLQTIDEQTLERIQRSNIATSHYVKLAADLRRRGHLVFGELMMGLPGQTFDSFKGDLQFLLDLEVQERTWLCQVLPNAPMNDPEYRARWEVETDADGMVRATSTFGPSELARMTRLRKVGVITERFGLLRHILRLLQWDYDIPATDVMVDLMDLAEAEPGRYPLLAWTIEHFDLLPTVPVGWTPFYREVRRFVLDRHPEVEPDALDCVIGLQQHLMPSPGRQFPTTVELEYDYVSYYRSATDTLYTTGWPGRPSRALTEYPRSTLTVEADPLALCSTGVVIDGDSRDPVMQGDFYIGGNCSYELRSPLLRLLCHVANRGEAAPYLGPSDAVDPEHDSGAALVTLGRRGPRTNAASNG